MASVSLVTVYAVLLCCITLTYGRISSEQYGELSSEITSLIQENNCAPILVRLAWHDSGTYDKDTNTGGPRAAQRFVSGESKHAANNGLEIARNLLQPLVQKYSDTNIISIADLWALAGNIAIKASNGPNISFRFGRKDVKDASECVEDGRLPDAKQGIKHVRNVLNRIGFTDDRYIVALSGAHTLGSCHSDRSGFEGAWTDNPYVFDNSYFVDLVNKKWSIDVSSVGNTQFVNENTMMLPSDWTLYNAEETRGFVELYAADQDAFFKDFGVAWKRLIESGYDDTLLYSVELPSVKQDL